MTNEIHWTSAEKRVKIAEAKKSAVEARKRGDYASANSIMLSCYIGLMKSRVSVIEYIKAGWSGLKLYMQAEDLNHNQLDVLIQFLLKIRERVGIIDLAGLLSLSDSQIEKLSRVGAKPHQIALALMTRAEILSPSAPIEALSMCQKSLTYEMQIEAEKDQPQGRRQLVRIFRKAGEIYCLTGNRAMGKHFLERAMFLAEGAADTPDQVMYIRKLLKN